MLKTFVIILGLFFLSNSLCLAQSPTITFASSFYRTTAGAIGPTGVISTTSYDLKIDSHKTIILDSAVISGLKIIGDGIIIPTNTEGTIEFQILIATHQKDTVWYNGELEFQGIKVSANVSKATTLENIQDNPVIVLFLRTSASKHIVIKKEFDQKHSQYNK